MHTRGHVVRKLRLVYLLGILMDCSRNGLALLALQLQVWMTQPDLLEITVRQVSVARLVVRLAGIHSFCLAVPTIRSGVHDRIWSRELRAHRLCNEWPLLLSG